MKKCLFFAVPALVLLLSACNNGNNDGGGTPSRDFYAVDNRSNTFYTLTADCLAENDYCMVYADQKANVDSGIAQNIADGYAGRIHGPITDTFGTIMDVDGNGKVIFLLLDILDGFSGGGYIGGYFYSLDMMKKSEDPNVQAYYSNEADMLYIDTKPGLQNMSQLYSTMAHELQHLINYSNTAAKDGREQDLWINEGLSTAAEFIYGRNSSRPTEVYKSGSSIVGDPNGRLIIYSDPNGNDFNYSIRNGNNFYVWEGWWEVEGDPAYGSLGDYATVYLFFQWLRAHASNGTGIYKEIINSSYRDYRAVTSVVRQRFTTYPPSGLSAGGIQPGDWDIVLRSWLLANFILQDGGLYGYKGAVDHTLINRLFHDNMDSPWSFSPGEGVYSQLNISESVTVRGYIKYVPISTGFTPGSVIESDTSVTGEYLLTYNGNFDNKSDDDEGDVFNASAGLMANRLFSEGGGNASWGYLPGNYPVDRDTMARIRENAGKPSARLNKNAR